jgi:hypothetical protein
MPGAHKKPSAIRKPAALPQRRCVAGVILENTSSVVSNRARSNPNRIRPAIRANNTDADLDLDQDRPAYPQPHTTDAASDAGRMARLVFSEGGSTGNTISKDYFAFGVTRQTSRVRSATPRGSDETWRRTFQCIIGNCKGEDFFVSLIEGGSRRAGFVHEIAPLRLLSRAA